jgi:NTP pyrophosphatase (non-canonical NTP hydrolase)
MREWSLAEWQAWAAEFDRVRGWDATEASQVVAHLTEELGEVAREVLRLEGYKAGAAEAGSALAGELADLLMMVFKLAAQSGLDLAGAVAAKGAELEGRFAVAPSREETRRFLEARISAARERLHALEGADQG